MSKIVKNVENKEDAVCQIIADWGRLQYFDVEDAKHQILEKLKKEYKEVLEEKNKNLSKCWKEYSDGIDLFGKKYSKKFKISEKRLWDLVDSYDDFEKKDEKIGSKVFDAWEKYLENLQDKLVYDYELKGESWMGRCSGEKSIEHEEGHFVIKDTYRGMALEVYDKEMEIRLSYDIRTNIEMMFELLRGQNSFYNIIKESKEYLKEAEKKANNITSKQEEEFEAIEKLLGV